LQHAHKPSVPTPFYERLLQGSAMFEPSCAPPRTGCGLLCAERRQHSSGVRSAAVIAALVCTR
jgi:hypothetical protein